MGSPRSVRDSLSSSAPTAFAGVLAFLAGFVGPSVAQADVSHVVGKGHTIATIAARYHVSAKSITDANPKANPKRLRIGETLTIPGVAPKAGDKAAPPKSEGQAKAAPQGKTTAPAGSVHGPATTSAPPPPPVGKGKDGYAAKPKHPNVVHLVRFGTGEEATVNVSARGKVPGAALEQFKKIMHSTSGATLSPDARLVALLGIVSNHFGGRKIEIISGFRPFSPKQYTPHSNHNHGRAMDFRVQGVPNTVLRDFCRTLHDVGVGYYPNSVFVHLDVRPQSAFWIDYSKPGEPPRYHAPNVDADEGTSDVHAEHPTLNGPAPAAPTEAPAAPGADAPKADAPKADAPKVELPQPSPGAPATKP
ncbi:MAG: DUF882 domain-containing protein [Polyangiaceae bacterium]